jgi:peptidoglycan/xylan/chitin deacetylase (PgdA/CDA1 family)
VLADLRASGHLLGNHTLGHRHLDTATTKLAFAQIWGNERELEPYLGERMRLFRPPYGKLSAPAARLVEDLGYTVVRWSLDPRDFPEEDAKALRKRVVAAILAAGGGVLLLHDAKAPTMAALPGILADLERANCRRLARGLEPILPVSLDYFATDTTGELLPIAPDVAAQTERTRQHLVRVCKRD